MNEIMEQLPKTPKEIYESIVNGEKFGSPLDGIIGKKFKNLKEIFDFIDKPDELTDVIYGKPDNQGIITFPFAVEEAESGVVECRGKLGDQTSRYNKENMKQHTAMVAGKLFERLDCPRMAACYAVLHDCGKKYTCGTNSKGDLCFYGHATVSAYLAGAWMRNLYGTDGDSLMMVIVVIAAHMLPNADWRINREKRDEFFEDFHVLFDEANEARLEAERLIDTIAESDRGCLTEAEVKSQKALIDKGLYIIDLIDFCC